MFDTVRTWVLPHVVEGVENNDVVTTGGLDGADGCRLLGGGSDGDTVAATLVRPAGFDAHDVLTTGRGDSLHLLQQPGTGFTASNGPVPVGVGVEGNVVGVLAEFRVVQDGNVGVDRDDWTRVAGGGQEGFGGGDVLADLGSRGLAVVDKLVTDGDSVDVAPGAVGGDGARHLLDTLGELVDEEDAQEQLLAVGLGLEDVFNLVTVDAVQSDETVVGQLGQVGLDGGQVLAGAVAVVRRVGDTLGGAREAAGAAGARGGGSRWSWGRRWGRRRDDGWGHGGGGGGRGCCDGVDGRGGGRRGDRRVTADVDHHRGLDDHVVSLVHVVQVAQRRGDR